MTVLKRLRALYAQHGEKVRFLVVGVWNTMFSYGMLWILESIAGPQAHESALASTVILTINWVIGVTQNLFTFKLLVFRTKGNWLKEYLRSFVVYAGTYVANLAIVLTITRIWDVRLIVAQLPAIFIVTIISYVGHKYFTYRTPEESLAETIEEDAGEVADG